MNTNDKTLADVQPGGMVRLGDALPPLPKPGYVTGGDYGHEAHNAYTPEQMRDYARAVLSAQPSPGGQDALDCIGRIEEAIEFRVPYDIYAAVHGELAELKAALAARQPVSETVAYQQGFRDGQDRTCTVAASQPVGQGDSRSEKAETFLRQYLTYLRSSPRQGLRPRWCDVYEALEVAIEALAARQPVGEPVALVVPGAPTRCRHCESTDLEWFAHVRAVNDVPHGRLTTHDVGCVFVLGCNECSETLHTVKADSIAALLAAPPAQAVDLGAVREMLESWKNSDYPFSYEGQCAQRALNSCIADLKGWLDSQAVGNGN